MLLLKYEPESMLLTPGMYRERFSIVFTAAIASNSKTKLTQAKEFALAKTSPHQTAIADAAASNEDNTNGWEHPEGDLLQYQRRQEVRRAIPGSCVVDDEATRL